MSVDRQIRRLRAVPRRAFEQAVERTRPVRDELATRRPATAGERALRSRLEQVQDLIDLGIYRPEYEDVLTRHYSAWLRPGDIVLDVGAHGGQHLRQFLELVGPAGRVIGFEPLPEMYQRLRRKFPEPNVALHKVALGRRSGKSTFVHAVGSPAESGLKQREYNRGGVVPEILTVNVRRMDSYTKDLPRLDWVKIDVEGGEVDCLAGGPRTLRRLRPVVSVEYGRPAYSAYGNSASTLYDLARLNRYVLLDLFLNVLDTRRRWLIACDSVYWDYFMVPREKVEEFLRRVAP